MADDQNPWWVPVETFKPSDINKTVEGSMYRAGAPATEFGRVKEAYNQANMAETTDKLAQALGVTPPMNNDMLQHTQDYSNYMEASLNGEPMRKQGYFGGPVLPTAAKGGIPPHTDPLNSQTRWGIPTWREDVDPEEKKSILQQARSWSRWNYYNHPIVPTCMDIYAKYPFVGLDLQCPDPRIEEEYQSMFFDVLNYEDHLPNAALQYWINGEAAILGQWDDTYKGWVKDKVMNSDDIDVVTWPAPTADKEAYLWYPPADLVQLLQEQDIENPVYLNMIENFGDELLGWAEGYPSELPSDVFSLLRFGQGPTSNRGIPILMRAFYSLMMEEKLKQAMTAVADRLYTPFIVVKLGSKDLLQGQYPWMPTPAQMTAMQAHLEMVMISKYRLMVYHSGIEFENPFEGQQIPDLEADFDRITTEILNVFGISKELIQGGGSGTYASGALSAEIMMQQLATTQQKWSRWWIMERAKKVAEARGYYQIERKGNTYTKPMERIPVWDPVSKSMRIKERRKLMLPAIRMETMDWRDQETKARGLQELRQKFDIPISDQRLVSFYDSDLDVDDERMSWAEERKSQFDVVKQLGEAAPMQRTMGPAGGGPGGGMPGMGGGPGGGRPPGSGGPGEPGPGGIDTPDMAEDVGAGGGAGPGDRPPASDNMRASQPNTGGPGPVTTSYNGNDYITVDSGDPNNLNVSEYEQQKFASSDKNLTQEEVREMERKTARWKKNEKNAKTAYSSKSRANVFRKTGKQKGTLYFMQGERMMAARVK